VEAGLRKIWLWAGWIDKKLMDTKEGDLQALKRLLDEIKGERRVYRSDVRPPTEP
jgi:hypothetical protein